MRPTTDLRLLYVYDALCGWCYGFSPVMRAQAAESGLPVDVLSGGMIRGARRGPIGEVAAYIKSAYKDVERRTGVRFGAAFVDGPLERGDMYMTSEPPAALLAHVRETRPECQLDAAHALQEGIYGEGLGPSTPALARHLATAVGIAPAGAIAALTDARLAGAAARDFALAEQLGVRGFPAVFVVSGESAYPVAQGYVDGDAFRQNLARAREAIARASAGRP